MTEDREIAGIRCMAVLALLDRFVEGDMDPDERAQVTAHVSQCDNCARFGAAYAATINQLRGLLPPPSAGRIQKRVMNQIKGATTSI